MSYTAIGMTGDEAFAKGYKGTATSADLKLINAPGVMGGNPLHYRYEAGKKKRAEDDKKNAEAIKARGTRGHEEGGQLSPGVKSVERKVVNVAAREERAAAIANAAAASRTRLFMLGAAGFLAVLTGVLILKKKKKGTP